MGFKVRYMIFYLLCWALLYACTSTWVWVRGSDRVTIGTESELDSIQIGGGEWYLSDDDQIGSKKTIDTVSVKDTLKIKEE